MTLKFTEKVKLKAGNDLVMTYRGRDANGRDFFAYIKCEEKGVILMREDYQNQNARLLSEYGEVIYQDYLVDPDDKAIAFLKEYTESHGGSIL